ncbi:protein dispatched homolog 3 isoform X1 [Stegostoma tigrinum]|uniref:protein dispatched homolog 3 isoform X1 n=1 Tax=Stegostoma tigrinum TaxID=3053191 RepID=UPI0028704045|nr:protein dispatched homolog 3 isoform X1 [Stegostoma tigrinum]XP_059494061.1 protein dispatched homolog 3 isoform X1 [Stegostoma tigrinum]XP_059494062.1 protein dispatched homolog 3 isoform X1 [Stegostoma tigrinum]XP_059494063.1 protein dispatched homolog 3 isoform X1 [Stegostoma tigrinum]XP_059494064.1 protein dispatched homolog 3 isoform X1 [Stegostoma tigrinum]XP_059494065.1 protein dispatched homolog 3 isoform X1 [Stegostoma tigrinum]XP_059494066.1 protein dispatched homolog 3 isoform X
MECDDDPLVQHLWLEEEEDNVLVNSYRGQSLCKKCHCNFKRLFYDLQVKGFWGIIGWIFTNPYCTALILVIGCIIPTILTVVMLLRCSALDIDISYNAFEIRNHISSLRFDALTLALKSQFGSWGRNRRDLAEYTSATLEKLIIEELQKLHNNSSQLVDASHGKTIYKSGEAQGPDGIQLSKRDLFSQPATKKSQDRYKMRKTRAVTHMSYPNTYINGDTQTHALWRMELVFLARGDDERNIFTKERLLTIHDIEKKVMDHPRFREFCWKPHEVLKDMPLGSYSYCSPPSSLMTYFFPTAQGGRIYYDGMGQKLADIHGSLKLAITHPEFYWYVDEGLTAENMKSSLLRSEILFGAPLPNYYSVDDRWEEQHRKFQKFVISYADLLASQSTKKVQVLYGGTDLFDYEVRRTFKNDMMLAFISSGCIAVLVYVLTSFSAFLTFFGIASIGLSCLIALFLYHVVFGIQYLGILNGVAAFVIVGIGVDDVFVFINTFRQASHLHDPQERMIHTIKTAGKATFFTSFTTAAAYAANIFSQIPAVHDFGLFMSLIVACCWMAVLFLMPAALCIWSLYISPLDASCYSSCQHMCKKKDSSTTQNSGECDQSLLVTDQDLLVIGGILQYLDDDIPLLAIEEEAGVSFLPGASLDNGDVPLVSLVPEAPLPEDGRHNPCQMITRLQDVLYHFVALPAVKSKWIILGLYIITLVMSIGFATQLRAASRTPLLFSPDTNIQVLLDLKYNLSAEGISCITCSGVFQEKPQPLLNNMQTSSDKKKQGENLPWNKGGGLQTVYVTKYEDDVQPAIYRFSLDSSVPWPWHLPSTRNGEIPSFKVYTASYGNFTKKLTVCSSVVGLPSPKCPKKWMITSLSCNTRKGWKLDFHFYASATKQHHTQKLYFAQLRKTPYHSRICLAPPGCILNAGPNGPNKGFFYVPDEKVSNVEETPTFDFNPCMNNGCGKPAVRPLVDTGAMVFVVFGILGVNRTRKQDNHVIGDMGSVIYDENFDLFQEIGNLCKICKAISSNSELVKPGGAQCLPSGYSVSTFVQMLHPECKSIPEPNLLPGQLSHGAVGVKDGKVQWISMAFESTTYKGKSSFQTYADYLKWENYLQEQLHQFSEQSSLRHGFQTCEHWKQIFMEIIGVQSAMYSLILSLVICIAAVAIFTTHVLLLLPVLLTILGVICLMVAIMYWFSWEMGAVEAISLSILVGSSVDYCVHLVEGYLLAGENLPITETDDKYKMGKWRTLAAVRHVGVAIVSSAITTVIATIPLFFCIITPFAKFGKIVALNTGISIFYTLTVNTALLSILAPSDFYRSRRSFIKAVLGVVAIGGGGFCVCLVLIKLGFKIPLPNGSTM